MKKYKIMEKIGYMLLGAILLMLFMYIPHLLVVFGAVAIIWFFASD